MMFRNIISLYRDELLIRDASVVKPFCHGTLFRKSRDQEFDVYYVFSEICVGNIRSQHWYFSMFVALYRSGNCCVPVF